MLNVLEKADNLYKEYKIDDLHTFLLDHKEEKSDEIQWRLARATHDKAKHEKDKNKRQYRMLEAFGYAEKALELNAKSPHCHRWYGALLHFTTEGISLKHKIQTAYKVREHFDKALEFDPEDSISLHSIGYWCFVFADTPWYQKKLASTFIHALPETSFEEALKWFLKAEEVSPLSMCTNCLMIAKTYSRMRNKEKAVEYLQKTLQFELKTPDDFQSYKEAEDMLKNLGQKVSKHQK